ncbi:MAG: autotransporter domain-containing protein, partial [Myxococcota bacterium]|nr:autotransporter domain-containing protein [Myxococcota bacterium]
PDTESRVENRLDALIGFDPASFALEEIGVAILGSDGDDIVMNAGLIRGQVKLGKGDDRYLVEPGGRLDALGDAVIDGKELAADTDINTVELTAGAGGLGEFDASRIRNFESIRVTSGQWQLAGQTTSATDVVVDRAGTLSVSRPTTINGNYSHVANPNPFPQPGDPEPTLQLLLGFETESAPVLTVEGTAALDHGVLELVVAGGFLGEASFILLQADDPLDGAFDRIVLPDNPNFVFTDPVYSANQIDFLINVSGYSDNQFAVSQAITKLSGTGIDPSLQALIDQVESLDFDSYLAAMDALSPEAYDAHAQARFELGERFVRLMLERPRLCPPGLADAVRKAGGNTCRERILEPWVASYGQFGHRSGGADHISTEDDGGGIVLGFDRRVDEGLLVSATVGSAYDSISVKGVGPGDFKTLDLGLYAGYTRGGLRLEGVASYGHGWHELYRNISVGDFSGQAVGRYDMERLGLRARVEYALSRGPLVVSPMLSLDYTALLQSEVNEIGAGPGALSLPSRNDTARTLRVGFDATTALEKKGYWTEMLEYADGVWRPTLSLRWRQPLGETNPAIPAAFSVAPSDPFDVFGDDSGEGFEVGVGLAWTPLVADRLTFTLRYDGFLWQGVSSNSFTGRVRFSF